MVVTPVATCCRSLHDCDTSCRGARHLAGRREGRQFTIFVVVTMLALRHNLLCCGWVDGGYNFSYCPSRRMGPYEGEMLRLAMSLAIPLAAARVVKTLGVTLFNLGKKDKFWPGYV